MQEHTAPLVEQATNHTGQVLLGTAGGTFLFGLTIGQLNQYLQAGAFVLTMISAACAAMYYVKKTFFDK